MRNHLTASIYNVSLLNQSAQHARACTCVDVQFLHVCWRRVSAHAHQIGSGTIAQQRSRGHSGARRRSRYRTPEGPNTCDYLHTQHERQDGDVRTSPQPEEKNLSRWRVCRAAVALALALALALASKEGPSGAIGTSADAFRIQRWEAQSSDLITGFCSWLWLHVILLLFSPPRSPLHFSTLPAAHRTFVMAVS